MGRKSVKSVLWVSADGLRVVDDKTKVGDLWAWEWAPMGSPLLSLLERGLLTHLWDVPPSETFEIQLWAPVISWHIHSHNSGLSPVAICEPAWSVGESTD